MTSTKDEAVANIIWSFILQPLLGGWALQYILNFWLPFIANHFVHVPYWPCVLAGFIVGRYAIAAWALTLVVGLVM